LESLALRASLMWGAASAACCGCHVTYYNVWLWHMQCLLLFVEY